MAKAKARTVRSNRHPADETTRRFVDGPVRETSPTVRTVQTDSVDVEARTLSAVVATGTGRVMEIYDDDLDAWIEVEEVINIDGMDLSRVESGMQFLDNHNSWERAANLGVVTEARIEDIEGVGPAVVVDIKMSSRSELDSLVQDLADGIVGCISCQYRPTETTLELRTGKRPLLTVVKSELLEVSLVSVPADPNALVRSETSLKGQDMTTTPKGGAANKRGATQKPKPNGAAARSEELDETKIAEMIQAGIAEQVDAIVETVITEIGGDENGDDNGGDDDAARADNVTTDEEEEDNGGAATDVRSMIRSALNKRLGKRSDTDAKREAELKPLRAMADKYGVRSEFDDMASLGVPTAELRSFVVNSTAARSGTGQTHDGRNKNPQRNELSWDNSFRGKRAAERATRR